jgi:serine/threonine-protein kinase
VAAQALFDEAKALTSKGFYGEACPKLAESEKLDPGLGTEFHLADCWQHLGRTATAWALFRQVESEAHALGQPGRERVAHDRATALAPFLPKLVIEANAAASIPGLTITRDGDSVSREQWGAPIPIDPGTHVVAVQAPDKQPWETTVEVAGGGATLRVDVPLLADRSPPAPAPVPVSAPAPAPAPPMPPGAAPTRPGVTSAMPLGGERMVVQSPGGVQRAVGWILVGAGVAGLAAAAYFGGKWLDEHNSHSASRRDDATTQGNDAEAALGASLAALFVGTCVVVTAPGPRLVPQSTARVELSPIVGPTHGGLTLRGSF